MATATVTFCSSRNMTFLPTAATATSPHPIQSRLCLPILPRALPQQQPHHAVQPLTQVGILLLPQAAAGYPSHHHPGLADGAWQLNLRARPQPGLKVSRALEGRNWLTRRVACLSGGCWAARLEDVSADRRLSAAAGAGPDRRLSRAVLEGGGAEAQADPGVAYFGPFSEQVSKLC